MAHADAYLRIVDEGVFVESDPDRFLDLVGAIFLGRLDRDAVDDIAAARNPPGQHAGEPLRDEPRHPAVEDDDALFDFDFDLAASIGRVLHELSPSRLAFSDPKRGERRFGSVGLA